MIEFDEPSTSNPPDHSAKRDADPVNCTHANIPAVVRDYEVMLREAGLRPTRQRLALAQILYSQGDRHVTAEMLHGEATRNNLPASLATVYNTLNQFAKLGLLREVGVDGSITYFDTKTSDHHHFFIEGENEIRDIPTTDIRIGKMAAIPQGYEIARVDLLVRLRRKR
jgi:Fur family transcriptional regulator, iron response regulator